MKRIAICLLSLLGAISMNAQPLVIDLWPDGAPNDNGLTGPETQLENGRIGNVTHPTLTVYLPAKPNGQAIIACPGGGYVRLAPNHEGHDMSSWMNNMGVTYAVLKYRMPNGNMQVPISDALQAIKIMREHAEQWHLDPHMIGIMGASAGGNLATQAANRYTGPEDKPDFQILFYAVTEAGAKRPEEYDTVKLVNEQTPPAFILCAADDPSVPCTNSIDYFLALRNHKVSASLHIYPSGGHGWGYLDSFVYKREWTEELDRWLREMNK